MLEFFFSKVPLALILLNALVKTPEQSGSLNPMWVEWLMGFPVGWTACGVSETRSFRKSSKSSAGR